MPSFIVHLIVDRTNRFVPVRTRTISSIKIDQSKNRFFEIRKSREKKLTIENEKGEKVLWQIGHGYPPSKTDSARRASHCRIFRITADP